MSDNEFEIKINSKFAEEYERRKKEEDLNTIKEKFQGEEVDEERLLKIYERQRRYGTDNSIGTSGVNIKVDADDSEESDSEFEDEQAALITPEVDSQILKTIVLLKTKNADIYDSSKKFFDDKALEEARERLQKKKKQDAEEAPVTLKTLQQERFSKGFVEDLEEEDMKIQVEPPISLEQEQRKLKQELKMAASESKEDSDDEFFSKRKQTDEERLAEEEEYRQFLLQEMAKADSTKQVFDQWASYKDNPNIGKDDAFLMDYVLNRGWLDKDVGKVPTYDEIVGDIEEEEELDKVDNFEREYNFRFEEPGSSLISTYPRIIPGLIRETKSKRSIARSNRQKRKKAALQAEEEQLKRQKNEKMSEFKEKMHELDRLTGGKISRKDIEAALDADFDPETFGVALAADSCDDEDDIEKPQFDDDIDINHIVNQQTPEEAEEIKEAAKKLLEDYYKLDREDKIDDLNTRFKYQKVEKDTGGLTYTDIILADDKDLNQVIPMAALAPYFRESKKPFKPKSSKIRHLREKLVEEGHIAPSNSKGKKPKKSSHDKSKSSKKKKHKAKA